MTTTAEVVSLAKIKGTKKRGRPRKPGPRERSGRLARHIDYGTPEARKRRLILAGAGGDEAKTGAPLDVLHTRGLVSDPLYEAGRKYGVIRNALFGPPHADSHLSGPPTGNERTEEAQERLQQTFTRLRDALDTCGRRERSAVENVVVYERFPGWFVRMLIGHRPRPSDDRERAALLDGLAVLAVADGRLRAKEAA